MTQANNRWEKTCRRVLSKCIDKNKLTMIDVTTEKITKCRNQKTISDNYFRIYQIEIFGSYRFTN